MEERELFKEMARLDAELLAMIVAEPDPEEIYAKRMAKAHGSVVNLSRTPKPEDWARVRELANRMLSQI